MNEIELQQYLYEHIPQSAAMEVEVVKITPPDQVTLSAPLAPNINHRDSLFGGSASSIAILAAWSLLYTRVAAEGIKATLVIQRNTMSYDRPVLGTFHAKAGLAEDADWAKFLNMLRRKGKARIKVTTRLEYNGAMAGTLKGDFVAVVSM
ncbi:MAG: thioesterase [Zetaproteobacteria bacterium CG_4_9_14_3_um_filter_49_83]|nr:MAG: thioesterase [Zetaproteobacteria bacterium CG1_02_49_23]PIQ33059.1 MAG: thioesterase [Zetaproteobacteria bacterium CG17_big_fil_post_rev_8_21_14_2_50_50_13]PIV31377.1 MAG: thioesterase [Zetaproteobacteria bacterium CG02_land_8_20_14_3_00_50_9]PIY56334.1 MAG: thioesterase [Zetaproteobacteria bacterium CG_4_10_14_0_8_um_filter_49_80]PJA35759.1 MAG: thioesterase [Zetaproteobacteria bacterium CG_4_9_14_3_um_filter_49_83]